MKMAQKKISNTTKEKPSNKRELEALKDSDEVESEDDEREEDAYEDEAGSRRL